MRRFLLFVLALLMGFTAGAQFRSQDYAALDGNELTAEMREHIGFLSSYALEGRKSGSEGEKEAAEYISAVLQSYGLDVLSGASGDVFGVMQENGDTLTSRNVVACIPGYDPDLRDRYIVVGARMDNLGTRAVNMDGVETETVYCGANGNASGLAMMMQLAKRLNTNRVMLKRSVLLVAFGASVDLQAGSWYFLNRSYGQYADKIDAMVNLDMVGTGGTGGFYVFTGSNPDLNDLVTKLSGTLQPVQPRLVSLEPVQSDHRMFYDKEIPFAFFTTGMYPEYNTGRDTESIIEYDWMERILEYVYNYTMELVNGKAPEFRRSDESGRSWSNDDSVVPWSDCDVKPAFLGSMDPSSFLSKWVYVYLRYPRECVENGIQGRVLVNFTIDEKGRVGNVQVVRGVHELLDAEAVRVISASPNWRAARVRGQKVKCELSMYVEFKLEKR